MHIIYDIKSKIASELAGFGFDSSSWQLNLSTAQNVFSKFRPGWWQFCWMTGVKFNSIQSILDRFVHITQFTVCAAKNLTVFVVDSPRCLEWSSMVVAVSRALRELSEPCLGWTRERTQTFRANLLDSLCDVLHTYGLDFGLHLRHLRDEYTRKEVGDYYAAMCPISHNILLRLEAVVNRWTKRVTRGLIGRVRSANICGGRKLHKYVSTNVWTMKNVSTQQMSRSVRYMTLQSGTVALRWLFSCWNKHGRLSRDQSPSGHVRSQAISCLANRSHHAYVLMH